MISFRAKLRALFLSSLPPVLETLESNDEITHRVKTDLDVLLVKHSQLSVQCAKASIGFDPMPDIPMTQWADSKLVLSQEDSAEHGKYRSSRTPYVREIMNAISDAETEEVIWVASAQVGKTQVVKNAAAYYIDQDPSSMMVVQPTLDMAEAFSKERLAPMIRDNKFLSDKISDKSRDGNSTILVKLFPGGHIVMVGSNSVHGLASRPIKVMLQDEIDKYDGVGAGDPVVRADNRTTTFWDAKKIKISTPLFKENSRILKAFERGSMEQFWVPCSHCSELMLFKFGNIVWDKEEIDGVEVHQPETARIACTQCGGLMDDLQRQRAVQHAESMGGGWIAQNDNAKVRSFHVWECYSPFSSLERIVSKFLEAKASPELLQVFVNECLGEGWDESISEMDSGGLISRVEQYNSQIPRDCALLVFGADVQDDRIEVEVLGIGAEDENWNIDYRVFDGDPSSNQVWNDFDSYIKQSFKHESGKSIFITAGCIDSGGHHTQQVYQFCKERINRRIWAIKGSSESSIVRKPIWPKTPSRNNKANVSVYMLGTQAAKDLIFSKLAIEEPGPSYCHFPTDRNKAYFDGLTSEKKKPRQSQGRTYYTWVAKSGVRNEPLDCRVYAWAAYEGLKSLGWNFETAKATFENRVTFPDFDTFFRK